MFVVEAFDCTIESVPAAECARILQKIVRRPSKPTFQLTYYSPFYGEWRTAAFYVADGNISVKTLESGAEEMSEISCRMVGVNPL